jgi:DNA-binding transcriptional regulator LsrR (DeoR family)
VIEYSNSEISKVIDEYIHNQKYRDLMKRRYIDGILQETLAEEFNMSIRQVQNIIYKNENIIFKHLK